MTVVLSNIDIKKKNEKKTYKIFNTTMDFIKFINLNFKLW